MRPDCWVSYEAQDGFIPFAGNSTRWPSRSGLGCVVSYAVAIASVRETDRGSIGGSLEKLCGDGLMKSGSDMSQSHRLRMVECQGRNRAERVQNAGDGNVRICTADTAGRQAEHPKAGGLREWPPSPSQENRGRRLAGSPTVASAVYEGTKVHWTRSHNTQCTLLRGHDRSRLWPEWSAKTRSRDGLNTDLLHHGHTATHPYLGTTPIHRHKALHVHVTSYRLSCPDNTIRTASRLLFAVQSP